MLIKLLITHFIMALFFIVRAAICAIFAFVLILLSFDMYHNWDRWDRRESGEIFKAEQTNEIIIECR